MTLQKLTKAREVIITSEDIELLRRGDRSVFEKVYVHYMTPLKNFLFSLLKSNEKAEDIVTETFVALWDKRERLDPQKNIRSLIYTIAKNKIINQWSRSQVHEQFYVDAVMSKAECDFSPEELVIAEETRLLIELVIKNMPTLRRKVFELHQKGLDNETIALELNLPKANVANHISRAKKDIKAALK